MGDLRDNGKSAAYWEECYNLQDPDLLSVLDELPFWSAPFGMKILDLIPLSMGMKVLDIGSGMGFPLLELAMRLGASSRVYGVDPWKEGACRIGRKMGICHVPNVVMTVGFAEYLPFVDHCFDLIVSNNGLNNVQNLGLTLKECARVCKPEARFLFTFNNSRTFASFYQGYRQVLDELGMSSLSDALERHIYEKRKPLQEILHRLERAGFAIHEIHQDQFQFRFSDGSAMLNHFFIKLAFLPPWKAILPEENQKEFFLRLEKRLNEKAAQSGGLVMAVPFVTIDCRRMISHPPETG